MISRVDFCIDQTNLGTACREPIIHKTNDQFFRNEKRKYIKDKKPVEIAMTPLSGKTFATQMPDYLPVKLYFNKIKGLNLKVRQIVHEDLAKEENKIIEFRVSVNKGALDKLK